MWHHNLDITAIYASHSSMNAYATFAGIAGWRPVAPTSKDGVSNVGTLLSAAKALGKKVNVYIDDDGTVLRALVL